MADDLLEDIVTRRSRAFSESHQEALLNHSILRYAVTAEGFLNDWINEA
jgi:hypothetical protein